MSKCTTTYDVLYQDRTGRHTVCYDPDNRNANGIASYDTVEEAIAYRDKLSAYIKREIESGAKGLEHIEYQVHRVNRRRVL